MSAQTPNQNFLAANATSRETSDSIAQADAKPQPDPDSPESNDLFTIETPTDTRAIRG